jgi:hypothetical protein
MRWLVRLYPAAWRQRYGEEFAAVLAEQRVSVGLVIDVLGGAADAWLHPQVTKQVSQGEQPMTNAMIRRCALGGPKLSGRDQIIVGAWTGLGVLVLSLAHVMLRRSLPHSPAVEAINYMALPGMFSLSMQAAYLRKYRASTQAAMIVGTLGALYLLCWAGAELVARF